MPFPGADSTFSRLCGAISGRLAFSLATVDPSPNALHPIVMPVVVLEPGRPAVGRLPFSGANRAFSIACGAISGRLAFSLSAADPSPNSLRPIVMTGAVHEPGRPAGWPPAIFGRESCLFNCLRRHLRSTCRGQAGQSGAGALSRSPPARRPAEVRLNNSASRLPTRASSKPPAAVSRLADVDRFHGEHDSADFDILKENVHEMFREHSLRRDSL